MEIRYALDSERMEISKVHAASWRFAYKGIIPQDYLDKIQDGRWADRMDVTRTLVCVEDGRIVGTSTISKSRLERLPDCGEVISIYLLPDRIGKGYGKALMTAALSELKARGFDEVFLWVLEENERARRFYERFGFLPTDDFLDTAIGGKPLREVRYVYKNN